MKKFRAAPDAYAEIPADPSLIGYIRVSTEEQNDEMQRHALRRAGVAATAIYSDLGVSGAAKIKPGRVEALQSLRSGMTLVVWKLDRVSRDLLDLLTLLKGLEADGIGFRSLNEAIDTTTPMGKVMLAVLGAFAQFERDTAVQRTVAGIERAQSRGVKFGQPTKITPQIVEKVEKWLARGDHVPDIADRLGLAESTIRKHWYGEKLAAARAGIKSR